MELINIGFSFSASTLIVPVLTDLDPEEHAESLIEKAAQIALENDGIDCSEAEAEVDVI